VGVERVFPVNSPNIVKIEVDRVSKPMRARLYYLRDRVGKKAVQVKVRRLTEAMGDPAVAAAAPGPESTQA
jgi:large subunit ribosomal protein L19